MTIPMKAEALVYGYTVGWAGYAVTDECHVLIKYILFYCCPQLGQDECII